MYDILIENGRIADGAGNPWFRADLAIRGDKTVQIRPKIANEAEQVIDATGLIVAPGFIDTHTHSDVRRN